MDSDVEVFKNTSLEKANIDRIVSRLPEYHRASALIGHSTSQTSYTLQTLNMISDSPISRMKQCLAQIDKRFNALREAHFKVEKMKLEIIDLDKKGDKYSKLEADEKHALIHQIVKNMDQSLRQIGMFQDMYDNIMKNNNIPENWSEKDFEKQEIEKMIKSAYRLAIQDLTQTTRCSKAVVEWWEQLGIHPQVAEMETRLYLKAIQKALAEKKKVTIKDMYDFLDFVAKKHKDAWENVIARMGLDEIGSERYTAESVIDIGH